jgi:zinc protease
MRDPTYLTDDEIKNAVLLAEMNDMLGREQPTELSHTLSFWWTTAGLDYYFNYVANLKKVTRAQIGAFMDRYVVDKPFVLSVLASPEMVKGGLTQARLEAAVGAKPWVQKNEVTR